MSSPPFPPVDPLDSIATPDPASNTPSQENLDSPLQSAALTIVLVIFFVIAYVQSAGFPQWSGIQLDEPTPPGELNLPVTAQGHRQAHILPINENALPSASAGQDVADGSYPHTLYRFSTHYLSSQAIADLAHRFTFPVESMRYACLEDETNLPMTPGFLWPDECALSQMDFEQENRTLTLSFDDPRGTVFSYYYGGEDPLESAKQNHAHLPDKLQLEALIDTATAELTQTGLLPKKMLENTTLVKLGLPSYTCGVDERVQYEKTVHSTTEILPPQRCLQLTPTAAGVLWQDTANIPKPYQLELVLLPNALQAAVAAGFEVTGNPGLRITVRHDGTITAISGVMLDAVESIPLQSADRPTIARKHNQQTTSDETPQSVQDAYSLEYHFDQQGSLYLIPGYRISGEHVSAFPGLEIL